MNNTFDIDHINEQMLAACRLRTDPQADEVIAKVISAGFEKQINQVFMTIVQNDRFDKETFSPLGQELGGILFEYFEDTHRLPAWADPELILQGEQIFAKYGPEIFLLLNVSSLPLCYTCANGAQVLYDTGRLLTHKENVDPLARRLMETAQMITNVMSPGGLATGGHGIVTIQKVRLIHASIRYYLKQRTGDDSWDLEKFGEPINQEDLAGTLMSFGPVILSGLSQLNVELSEDEKAAYMHAWKVIGFLMGIEEALLPDTFEEGFELATAILKHQAAASEAGQALTQSCIDFVNHIIPGDTFDELPAFFMHTFLQDYTKSSGVDLDSCIGLSHDHDRADDLLLRLTKFIVGTVSLFEKGHLVSDIAKPFNKLLLDGIIKFYNDGKKVNFFIPPSLRKNWGVEDDQ
ncbi:MAG: oxygenase MpaB family protein [Reichenbachiella sp.]|uniref:oxygenase MpaB family protein n=1 Tax=Reichenbachiella sp. TaxID=2184521 RepID=UPI00326509E6